MDERRDLAKPVILTVDDEPEVLGAIDRDLRRHYATDYRIIKAGSGAEAASVVRQLKQRDEAVALFLADQRMPEMTGVEFLTEAGGLFPEARKVLLTAYADTEAAIASINAIGLDYYLLKPWAPPEQNLYPILDDLLEDWIAHAVLPFDGIRVVGSPWSPESHRAKDFLARNQVPYQWLNLDRDGEAKRLIETLEGTTSHLPVVFFPDGSHLEAPDIKELAARAGLTTEASQPFYDLIIVGAGPAGLCGAVYAGSEGLRTIILEKEGFGGQAGTSSRIENLLGFPKGLSGADLARRAITQVRRFGAETLTASEVAGIRLDHPLRFVVLADGTELACHALLVASGVDTRRLEAPGVEERTGAGVYYGAAVTEAATYRGQRVFVVGSGNSAGQGVVFLSEYAESVTVLVRGDSLGSTMSQYLVDRLDAIQNVHIRFGVEVAGVEGKDGVERVLVRERESGSEEWQDGAALFIYIGSAPRTGFLPDTVKKDTMGFVVTGPDLLDDGKRPAGWTLKRDPFMFETSIPGIFAAGDIRHGSVKRVAAAIGEGGASLQSIHRYLGTV